MSGIRSQYFAIVLYDEDEQQKKLLKYLMTVPLWLDYYVVICHDKDCVEDLRYSESEENADAILPVLSHVKKRHYHVLLKLKKRTHLKSFLNIFVIKRDKKVVEYALAVDNPYAYVCYMLHADFDSMCDNMKYKYKFEDLRASAGAEKLLFAQNANFVQYFQDILNRLGNGENLFDIINNALRDLNPVDAQEYLKIVRGYQYLFVQNGYAVARRKF